MDELPNKGRNKLLIGAIVYALILFVILISLNIDALNGWLSRMMTILRPVIIGLVTAYLCNPFFRFFERRVFYKLRPPAFRRGVSIFFTYLLVLVLLALVVLLIVPQLAESLTSFISSYESYIDSIVEQTNGMIDSVNGLISGIAKKETVLSPIDGENLKQSIRDWIKDLTGDNTRLRDLITNINFKPIRDVLSGTLSVFIDFALGFLISLYLLITKEKRYAQIMKLRHALFSDSVNQQITHFCKVADHSFGGFLEGKVIDSLIIGILAYVVVLIFRIPYPLLVATFIGITNIIPVIGPIIGAVPTSVIILLAEPVKVIPFLIIVVVIQQIDGNIIGPKILGNNTGVSSLCVMIAITTMGSIWGLAGTILGVPVFATVLGLTDYIISRRLQRKGLPTGEESYYAPDSVIDPSREITGGSDKTVRRMERKVLALKRRAARQGEAALSRKDRALIRFYELCIRHHLIGEMDENGYTRHAVEAAVEEARAECEQILAESGNASADAGRKGGDAV